MKNIYTILILLFCGLNMLKAQDYITYQSVIDPNSRALNTSYEVGSSSGSFNVSAIGAGTYSIALDVPAGVAGLQPTLSLTYNSLSGPGNAGYGWNLSGISVITRSPQAYCYDTNVQGITLTDEDRFALDGQRLVKISGTSYGSDGSVYRTQIDNISKVTCYTGSYGPDKFEVKTKSGLTCQYGYTSNSDQTVSGETKTLNWFVNKVTDVYNNEINYTYINDNGINYISQISYGPNTISFTYKQRLDKTTSYFVGNTLQQSLLLEKVEMKYNSALVKKYELKYNYQADNYESHSVLNEVIEYGINGSRFNSTVFSYEYPSGTCSNYPYSTTNSYISTNYTQYQGDYNGDGRMDILTVNNSDKKSWRLYLANVYGGLDYSTSGTNQANIDGAIVSDLNADGMDDLILMHVNGTALEYFWQLSTGTSLGLDYYFLYNQVGSLYYTDFYDFYANFRKNNVEYSLDFDGDGFNDFLVIDKINASWSLFSFTSASNNVSFTSNTRTGNVSSWGDKFQIADFNGDGKADIWTFDSGGMKVYSYNGSIMDLIYSDTYPNSDHLIKLGDFNGDGKTDIFLYGYQSYEWPDWQFRLSTGEGFEAKYFTKKKSAIKDDAVYTGDFNGDGRTDVLALSENTSGNPRQYYFVTNHNATDVNSEYYDRSEYDKDRNFTFGDFDGNGKTDIVVTTATNTYCRGTLSGNTNVLLSTIADGLNNTTGITYYKLSEQYSHYTKGTTSTSFPVFTYMGPLEVVSEYWINGGSTASPDYYYTGLKMHRQGKGVLGYEKVIVDDSQLDTEIESNYGYHSSKFFPELLSTIKKQGDVTISTVNNTWDYENTVGDAIFPYIATSSQTNNLTNQNVTTSYSCDSYGNPTIIETVYDNGVTKTTTNQYTNNTTNWYIGLLNSSTVEYVKQGETSNSNTVNYTYSTDGILKPDFIKFHEGTSWQYTKNHDYDGNGNLTQLYEQGYNVSPKSTNYTYETNGVRVETINDPSGHETEMFYDDYGRLSSEEDYLDNVISYTYDNMHRQYTESEPTGFTTTTTYNWGLTGGPSGAAYFIQTSGNEGSLEKIWYDKTGRKLRNDVKEFSGSSYYYTETQYTSIGQLYRISEPSTSITPSLWKVYAYFDDGRISSITRPGGRNTAFVYGTGNSRVTETTAGKSSWKETNSQGLLTTAHDNGGDIVYSYRPDGKVKKITSPGGVETTMGYDIAGNQTQLDDPSAGVINYSYDAFGRLKNQENARNQTTTYTYYADGRINTIISPEGTTTYNYNTNEQLISITSPGSVSRGFSYYSNGLTQTITETIPGSSTFSTSFTYDKGRLKTKTHPSGIVETLNYNSNGYLESISTGGVTRYTINSMNARQQVTEAGYGSGIDAYFDFDDYGYPTASQAYDDLAQTLQDYRYDFTESTGNLYSRQNFLKSKLETFTYDNLDRLETVSGPQNLTMDYADNGNITTKSDVGTSFEYNHATNPFALTDVETSSDLIPILPQTINYNSFEQVSYISEGDYYDQQDEYDAFFTYNSDNQRCKMEIKFANSTAQTSTTTMAAAASSGTKPQLSILTRWYVGSSYIKEISYTTTTEYTWIGGDAYTAPVLAEMVGSTTNYYYLLRDYLGNITHKVNTANSVVAEYNYDAWGRRRDKDTWSYTLISEPSLTAGRAFTGHEYLPWFNLYNMNGRLYDPVVGRFLSPDNNVQMPDFTQNFNRYSYALNNPLVYTDPSGEIVWAPIIAFAIWSGAVNVATHSQNIDNFWQGLGYFGIGAGAATLGGVAGQAASIATSFGSGALIGGAGAFGSSLIASGGNALLSGSGFNLNSSLIAGGIGALTGGLAGAANAHMANLESNNLLAYGYTVDVNNGTIQLAPGELGALGGKDVNFYNIGYYTDAGSAFVQLGQQVVEGANTINAFRFWQSAASTISAFSVPASGLTGYFMEPGGPDSNIKNSGLRIPEGQYDVVPHWRTKHYGRYSLQNSSLLGGRSGILMHYGQSSKWTEGCLLPACNWSSNNTISGSLKKLDALQLQIDKAKSMKVNIFNAFY